MRAWALNTAKFSGYLSFFSFENWQKHLLKISRQILPTSAFEKCYHLFLLLGYRKQVNCQYLNAFNAKFFTFFTVYPDIL